MLENFIYENHLGQRFIGLDNGVYLNYNDMRDYSWNYDTINSKISRFYRPITSRKLPLVVCGKTDEQAIAAKNHLLELAESDIAAKLPGKIYVGEYYTRGYITGSAKGNYLISKRLTNINLTFVSDDPSWYLEQTYSFFPGEKGEMAIGGGTDYPYDYPYDFALSLNGRKIVCDSVNESEFRLSIYGEAIDPAVVIGGHVYAVNGTIANGENVVVDSANKTVTLNTDKGNKVNWFDKRARENYIFKPIPAGQNTVSWIGTFGFDLTIIEKRSEPKWT